MLATFASSLHQASFHDIHVESLTQSHPTFSDLFVLNESEDAVNLGDKADNQSPVLYKMRLLFHDIKNAKDNLHLLLIKLSRWVVVKRGILDHKGQPVGVRTNLHQFLREA